MNLSYQDKTILITGGTGSFGTTFLNSLSKKSFKEIRVFSRDEKKQYDLRQVYPDSRIKFIVGDVRDPHSLLHATRNVDYIFHAAALKQVPACEFYPMQAVQTNVIGTSNVLEAALYNSVSRVVVLSTDKAVYPINAMGISKAMMEKVASSFYRTFDSNQTTVSITRYGNVLASRGSVIPLIVSQIKSGSPITVTDPQMTRFLLTLDDSVELVEYAFSNGEQGDLFVKKAPATTIGNLVNVLVEIFDASNPICLIGTRHGEKLHESLLSREELFRSIDLGDFYRVKADNRDLNYSKYFSDGHQIVSEAADYNSLNTSQLNSSELKELLLKLPFIQESLSA